MNKRSAMIVELKEVLPKEYYEILGIKADRSFQIILNKQNAGHIHLNIMFDNSVFIEWVELFVLYRGKGYFRYILLSLLDDFKIDKVSFDTSEDNIEIYKHLGAVIVEYDDIRGMTTMELHKRNLKINLKRKGCNNYEGNGSKQCYYTEKSL